MPYNPQATYIGGQLLAQGIGKFGEEIAGAIGKYQDQQKIEKYNDMLVQHAYDKGDITFDDVTKYNGMSQTQKSGFATGVAANFVDDYKRQEMAYQAERVKQLRAENLFRPSDESFAAAEATGGKLMEVAPHKYQYVPYYEGGPAGSAAGTPKVIPFIDPNNGKPVPGLGIATMPGTKQMQVVTIPQEGVQLSPDGNYRYDPQKRGWVPLTMSEKMAARIGNEPEARPNLWQRNMPTWLGGVNPTPTPGPTPATTPVPQQTADYGAGQGAPKAGMVRVSSPEEAAKLPSGTIFIDPNGVVRQVP